MPGRGVEAVDPDEEDTMSETHHGDAGRGPTPQEEAAAERADAHPERTAEPYEDMTEKGASQEGEGRPGR
jgi:hypothetical protein